MNYFMYIYNCTSYISKAISIIVNIKILYKHLCACVVRKKISVSIRDIWPPQEEFQGIEMRHVLPVMFQEVYTLK